MPSKWCYLPRSYQNIRAELLPLPTVTMKLGSQHFGQVVCILTGVFLPPTQRPITNSRHSSAWGLRTAFMSANFNRHGRANTDLETDTMREAKRSPTRSLATCMQRGPQRRQDIVLHTTLQLLQQTCWPSPALSRCPCIHESIHPSKQYPSHICCKE